MVRTGIAALAATAMLASGCATVLRGAMDKDDSQYVALGVAGDVAMMTGISYFVANEGTEDTKGDAWKYAVGSSLVLVALDLFGLYLLSH